MTYIEEYYQWILKHPKRVGRKVKKVYEKLVEDMKKPIEVSFLIRQLMNTKHIHMFLMKKSR